MRVNPVAAAPGTDFIAYSEVSDESFTCYRLRSDLICGNRWSTTGDSNASPGRSLRRGKRPSNQS
jgi:hypothetical protein